MQLVDKINKEKWNEFVGKQCESKFTQSWEWGELAAREGKNIFRLAVEENGEIIATALLIKNKLFGNFSYFYCPRGPIVSSKVDPSDMPAHAVRTESDKVLKYLFNEIEKLASKEMIVFLRFEPQLKIENLSAGRQGCKLKIIKTIDIQPAKTLMIYLREDDKELLQAMHQKTRYNIKLAEKKGVSIRKGDESDFENFWLIFQETIKRDGFRLHSKEHYKKLIKEDWIELYLAEYQGKILAGNITAFFGDTATYMHGASSNEYRNLMAPYALQWHCIKEARDRCCHFYDLYGIDEQKWPGVTRFKLGFGGRVVQYPGTYDAVFSSLWYTVYTVLRKIRRKI